VEWWDAVVDGVGDSTADVILTSVACVNKLFAAADPSSSGSSSNARAGPGLGGGAVAGPGEGAGLAKAAGRAAQRLCVGLGPLLDTWRMLPSHAQVRGVGWGWGWGCLAMLPSHAHVRGWEGVGEGVWRGVGGRGRGGGTTFNAINTTATPALAVSNCNRLLPLLLLLLLPPPPTVQVPAIQLQGHLSRHLLAHAESSSDEGFAGSGARLPESTTGSYAAALPAIINYLTNALNSLNAAVKLEAGKVGGGCGRVCRAVGSEPTGTVFLVVFTPPPFSRCCWALPPPPSHTHSSHSSTLLLHALPASSTPRPRNCRCLVPFQPALTPASCPCGSSLSHS
jgi:hypothetical protein